MHTLTAAFFPIIFWPRCRRMPVCCVCTIRNVAFLAPLVKQKEKWVLMSYTVVPHTNSIHRNKADSITMLVDTSEMGDLNRPQDAICNDECCKWPSGLE